MELVKSSILQALILTKDEEPNIGRVLTRLQWLEKIVILDSFSVDKTIEIAKSFPNVSIHERIFDTHATQWNYGLSLLDSMWVLSLDADYVLTDEFITELQKKLSQSDRAAYFASFHFLVFGKPLRRDNTTPRPVLFKRSDCTYYDDGHTQRLQINGKSSSFDARILHDDRKTLSRWLQNQSNYSIKECDKLTNTPYSELSFTSKLRKNKILAPIFVFFYCLFAQSAIFNGWRGWHYTLQRTIVEMLLALRLIEEAKLKYPSGDGIGLDAKKEKDDR